VTWLLLTNAVVRLLPFHCTTEVATKFEPFTVSVKPACPTTIVEGESEETMGIRLFTVKLRMLDVPPPGTGLVTVITAVPPKATSAAVIATVSCVELTNVVVRSLALNCAEEEGKKFVPVTVRLKPALPAEIELGFRDTAVGAGLLIVSIKAPEVPPPGAGLETVTAAVPAAATSAAPIAACSWVLETNVVARALPFHRTLDEEIKFVPTIVRVKAALPETAEAGVKDVMVGAGLGLTVEPPVHPTSHPKAETYISSPASRNVEKGSGNCTRIPSTTGLEDRVPIFIVPPRRLHRATHLVQLLE
jgi:hypothetical protein